ncbi:aroB [Symbiodinium microadriaticum]|nr:aroB [Symbiodinium microadriaticum]
MTQNNDKSPDAQKDQSIVLIGLMGAGKTTVGRRLAKRLGIDFVDADHEIEAAAGMSVPDIFAKYGEEAFRDGERKVIKRLLEEDTRHVLATGGGAFMDAETRALIADRGLSIWLRADLDLLVKRVSKRKGTRPLLENGNPKDILQDLMDKRYPIYSEAKIIIDTADVPHDSVVEAILEGLSDYDDGAAHPIRTITVGLDDRSYDIHVGPGLLDNAGDLIAPLLHRPRTVIVTDQAVAGLHLDNLKASLKAAGVKSDHISLPTGESTKSLGQLEALCGRLLDLDVERTDTIIALGGGVVGDLTGFSAAILRRGINFIQIPTTLLAQVDSSVGGKTGINVPAGKNLIGAFHQPKLVIADTGSVLDSLPEREFLAGYAEVVKYGLLGDADFFEWLEQNGEALKAGDADARLHAVATSVQTKAAIVARDEREGGVRALLNLGHTFGHALEAETGYGDRLLHGEAVAIGMVLAAETSHRMDLLSGQDVGRIKAHFARVGLKSSITDISGKAMAADRLLRHMGQDKKVVDGQIAFILMRAIGDAFVTRDVDLDLVKAVLSDDIAS